jgi:ribosomal protein S27E
MAAPGFWGAMWRGARRAVRCPYCQKEQLVRRHRTPYDVPCVACKRRFVVTESGAVAKSG